MEEMNPLSQAIVAGNLEQTQQLVRQALAEGMDTQTLINDYLTTGMAEIGQRFQDRKAFVPNLLMSARAMKGALEILKPYMTEETETRLGTIVIGTVKGDCTTSGRIWWPRCSRDADSRSSIWESTSRARNSSRQSASTMPTSSACRRCSPRR